MTKTQALIGVLVLAILAAGCQTGGEPTATPAVQARYSPVVSVTGELVPERWAALSHKVGGEVVEVLVEPGDAVSAGSPLVLFDTTDLTFSLETARQQVAAQQAVVDQLRRGATEQQIARVDRDNAHQVAQAEIALQAAQKRLTQAQARDPAIDVAAAEARVVQLERQMAQLRAQDPASGVELAKVEVERAQIALDDTQDEYNKALDRPWEDQQVRDGWAKQLEQAKLNYRAAQASLDSATNAQRAHALSLDVVEAQIEEARTMLAQAEEAVESYQLSLDVLQSDVASAQAQLRYLSALDNPYRDEATAEELAQAEALLNQARVAVAQIEEQLQEATVVAPFDGTVGSVAVRVGELVSPGQPLVVLGDLDTLRVETTDLDELDVVQVSEGKEVEVAFDALQDRTFKGRVTRVSPMAEPGTGGVHYTAIVELDELDPALRWGMTAFVDIETE